MNVISLINWAKNDKIVKIHSKTGAFKTKGKQTMKNGGILRSFPGNHEEFLHFKNNSIRNFMEAGLSDPDKTFFKKKLKISSFILTLQQYRKGNEKMKFYAERFKFNRCFPKKPNLYTVVLSNHIADKFFTIQYKYKTGGKKWH